MGNSETDTASSETETASSETKTASTARPRLGIVVAAAENGVIGRDGDLPWRLPDDLRNFKRLTVGHVLVMGRKTWESIGRPLPRRRSIVLSRRPGYDPGHGGVDLAPDLASALALAGDAERVFVVGGASLFAEALPLADDFHFTRVHAEVEGDVVFPEVNWSAWREVASEHHPEDERHEHAFTARHLVRREEADGEEADREEADREEERVMRCADAGMAPIADLLARYGLALRRVESEEIPGSYWGAPEAGLLGRTVVVRDDTPVHSCLHEAGHLVCMDEARRCELDTEAGGEDVEENAVCYLQILLADHLPGVGRERLMLDMDRWGYSFRLGSTRAWFERDADDARAWLRAEGLLELDADGREQPVFRLRD